jgi:glycosyltransferase involved in cell wall biosynthesis
MNTAGPPASVSVVIGSYNAAAWIGETLDSVLRQTHPVLEVLVIDDGSTDATGKVVMSYGDYVKWLPERHRGLPHRNRGIREAEGDFVAFVDADDFWQPQKIERQMALLMSTKRSWAICEAAWMDSVTGESVDSPNAPVCDGDILDRLFLGNFIVASTPLVAKHVFADVGYFNEEPALLGAEDWDLWLRIAARYPVACVREKLATLRLHPESLLASTPMAEKLRNLEDIIGRTALREPRLRHLRTQALANTYFAAGVQAMRRERVREARGYFGAALRHRPLRAEAIAYMLLTLLGASSARAVIDLKRRMTKKKLECGP